MAEIQLTQAQLDQIRKDMNEQVEMLTDGQVVALAQKVNKLINLPFLNEKKGI